VKLALNGATIMRSSLSDDVEIAAETGFDALEIWAAKLGDYLRDRGLDELARKMRSLGIAAWCINSIEDITFRDELGRRALVEETARLADMARALGAPSIVVVPGRRPDGFNRNESIEDAVDALRAMSDVAGDVTLAFEFLGKPGCAVPTLDMAVEIVEEVARPNVGLVIDTFHFYAGGSRLDDLQRVPLDRLCVVHVNGCEDIPREQLTDAHRLYPGEGVTPVVPILRRLHERGWDGVVSVEIFRPEYWERDPREVATSANAALGGVLSAAGYVV
jgi:2-keto-myo-inositol isomerase